MYHMPFDSYYQSLFWFWFFSEILFSRAEPYVLSLSSPFLSLFSTCVPITVWMYYIRSKERRRTFLLYIYFYLYLYIFPIRKENSNGRLGDSPSSSSTQPHTQSCKEKLELTLDESRLLNKQCRIYSF